MPRGSCLESENANADSLLDFGRESSADSERWIAPFVRCSGTLKHEKSAPQAVRFFSEEYRG
ncbi:conserved hypothetical protein [Xanthomonas citri pv. fuscans]|nr:conserved hypothetical protein [Xanthomonas citri pv. fuscans]SOO21243.1 conserved hypothetical protein [Xanthomonas citri pv. fuscans]SOO30587.1 conserved hypothetical protein [Xanthomonas citri pv. fuscans]